MSTVTARDGTEIFYKSWGEGPAVVFIHGWPLDADAWDDQLKLVAENGYHGIAHDRRGHGRSAQPWDGYDFDTFAEDLNCLLTHLDLRDVVLVGHSMGGGELARYIGLHGAARVSKAVLLSAITPAMLRSDGNPEGVPGEAFDDIRNGILRERSQYWQELAGQFFSADAPGSRATQGNRDAFWYMAMHQSIKAGVDCVTAFQYTDFTEDLRRFTVPTLLVHGDDDRIVPLEATARRAADLLPDATLKVYEGGSHGLALVPGDKERFHEDLLAFLGS
ncbi:alpha/beta hydrolase [Streptomyces tubbatahanensis]|uniref:Alpha/beta hydrolase n=1 Tax=Streptomyces tubbatahanensis TaxID=2923272 RepID=A0ABY3XWS5_9ACTN|nr:alpha/beta hydrolase [Streptomyces tubbatahanensis]UNS98925.1 alpha/beta hydrolase [Streptomyces tubbatahanensis]